MSDGRSVPATQRSLVIYRLGEITDGESLDVIENNIKIFSAAVLSHSATASHQAFYVFRVVGGKANKLARHLPLNLTNVALTKCAANTIHDLAAHVHTVHMLGEAIVSQFHSVLFLSHEARGPFEDRENGAWWNRIVSVFNSFPNVGVLGSSISCEFAPHVQSHALALRNDAAVLGEISSGESLDVVENNVKIFSAAVQSHLTSANHQAYYIFRIVGGKKNKLARHLPSNLANVALSKCAAHAKHDLAAHVHTIQMLGEEVISKFHSILFLSHEARGPFEGRANGAWWSRITRIFNSYPHVGILGSSISCEFAPHVQSHALALRSDAAVRILLTSQIKGLLETGLTTTALKLGYNISSLTYQRRWNETVFTGECRHEKGNYPMYDANPSSWCDIRPEDALFMKWGGAPLSLRGYYCQRTIDSIREATLKIAEADQSVHLALPETIFGGELETGLTTTALKLGYNISSLTYQRRWNETVFTGECRHEKGNYPMYDANPSSWCDIRPEDALFMKWGGAPLSLRGYYCQQTIDSIREATLKIAEADQSVHLSLPETIFGGQLYALSKEYDLERWNDRFVQHFKFNSLARGGEEPQKVCFLVRSAIMHGRNAARTNANEVRMDLDLFISSLMRQTNFNWEAYFFVTDD
eukprot:CAMPEP_0185013418 /NCGR_PEP_ID=MMETSP1098-20130426/98793_1 /TAXON_ID=89044 /ORGANISM="Spumella elongata, Strain CCAP 955/1" /LENGTH=643 /DNA_ID=CAMNT_0027542485 /DNA_START=142 /DNA_END=2071 /DNA_ORIENTATION=-